MHCRVSCDACQNRLKFQFISHKVKLGAIFTERGAARGKEGEGEGGGRGEREGRGGGGRGRGEEGDHELLVRRLEP
jgi:hypothetical protein